MAALAAPPGDPDVLRHAANLLGAAGQALEVATTIADAAVAGLVPATWRGTAADACASAQERIAADCRAMAGVVWDTAEALNVLAADLSDAIAAHQRSSQSLGDVVSELGRLSGAIDNGGADGQATLGRLERRRQALDLERDGLQVAAAAAHAQALAARVRAANAFGGIAGRIAPVGRLGAPCEPTTRAQEARAQLGAELEAFVVGGLPGSDDRGGEEADSTVAAAVALSDGVLRAGVIADKAKQRRPGRKGRGAAGGASGAGGGGSGGKGGDPERGGAADGDGGKARTTPASGQGYHTPPGSLRGFPGATRTRGKTPVRGGGGIRPRWRDRDGRILEWDYQEGHVEVFDRRGRHLGAFDPQTGRKLKDADPKRRVEP